MNRLVIFGDSNSYGMGLDDPKTQVYGYHLSKLTQRELVNNAICASSNTRIMFEILKFDYKPDDVVIVAWSYVFRESIFLNKTDVHNLGVWIDPKVPMNRAWLEELANPYDLAIKSYMHMHHAKQFFENKNIKNIQVFLEEDTESLNYKKEFNWTNDIEMSFDINSEVRHVDLTECRHPGPLTHKIVADHIYHKFKDIF